MGRPTLEITEEIEAWARRMTALNARADLAALDADLAVAVAVATDTEVVASAILAAIPEPPRPLAVGDVVDRSDGDGGPTDEFQRVVHAFAEPVVVLRDGDMLFSARTRRLYRVGEDSPAPWPWEVEA
jgi:hypothetical protein